MSNLDPTFVEWVIPRMKRLQPKFFWKIASTLAVSTVGCLSKFFIKYFNHANIQNTKRLYDAIYKRPKTQPLITIANHDSCFDDPGIWAVLKWKTLVSKKRMRWGLAAHDICYTKGKSTLSYFFMAGKCMPIVRGNGVYQEAVNYCIELLSKGEWVHVFPEGKVNMTKEPIRFKWGVGRMIYESKVTPIVVPIWHVGMERVLPNYPPYYLRVGQKVTINVGDPIDLTDLVAELRRNETDEVTARKMITDIVQSELYKLKEATISLHSS